MKAISIKREKVFTFILLLTLAIFAPFLKHQLITGTVVNATLFISVILLGARQSIIIGIMPSIFALSVGLLPVVLLPAVPFIMLANCLLILAFSYTKKIHFGMAIFISSALKFLFLYGINVVLLSRILENSLVSMMISLPQLVTAFLGGSLAFGILKRFKKI